MERPWPERRGAFISGSAGCRNPSIYIDCSSLEGQPARSAIFRPRDGRAASAALITCDATIPVVRQLLAKQRPPALPRQSSTSVPAPPSSSNHRVELPDLPQPSEVTASMRSDMGSSRRLPAFFARARSRLSAQQPTSTHRAHQSIPQRRLDSCEALQPTQQQQSAAASSSANEERLRTAPPSAAHSSIPPTAATGSSASPNRLVLLGSRMPSASPIRSAPSKRKRADPEPVEPNPARPGRA